MFDASRERNYTANIGGGGVSVHDATSPNALTTVPLKRANGSSGGIIELNLGETPGGRSIVVTANGSDDSTSILDRDVIESCVAAKKALCPEAEILRVKTRAGGAPEGIDYDAATNRIFVVNKSPIMNPSLSVVQLTENGSSISGAEIEQVPLRAFGQPAGQDTMVPAIIAFDVVVQER
jgi:hypothetical protein